MEEEEPGPKIAHHQQSFIVHYQIRASTQKKKRFWPVISRWPDELVSSLPFLCSTVLLSILLPQGFRQLERAQKAELKVMSFNHFRYNTIQLTRGGSDRATALRTEYHSANAMRPPKYFMSVQEKPVEPNWLNIISRHQAVDCISLRTQIQNL